MVSYLRKFLNLLMLPFAFGLVGLARWLAPWKRVRFGEFWAPRLGHMIGNAECYLCERDAGLQPGNTFDIWFAVPGGVSNHLIAGKYRRLMRVWPSWLARPVFAVNDLFPGADKRFISTAQVDRDINGLWAKHAPHIGFTDAETRRGEKLLERLGIPQGAKWVCLIVRDGAYLSRKFPQSDFSYHDYRDADVSNYMPAAVELMRRGYYIVRMGETVAKPFFVKHSKIIDYAVNGRTEFGDLYLGANCAFCLGTPTGFMAIPQAFNRPIAVTDFIPLGYAPTWCEGLMIWKHHMKDGKRMSVREIFEANLGLATFGDFFKTTGVEIDNNSAQEIFELAMEAADRDQDIARDESDQPEFWKNFPAMMINGGPVNGKIRIRIGREFLKGYQS